MKPFGSSDDDDDDNNGEGHDINGVTDDYARMTLMLSPLRARPPATRGRSSSLHLSKEDDAAAASLSTMATTMLRVTPQMSAREDEDNYQSLLKKPKRALMFSEDAPFAFLTPSPVVVKPPPPKDVDLFAGPGVLTDVNWLQEFRELERQQNTTAFDIDADRRRRSERMLESGLALGAKESQRRVCLAIHVSNAIDTESTPSIYWRSSYDGHSAHSVWFRVVGHDHRWMALLTLGGAAMAASMMRAEDIAQFDEKKLLFEIGESSEAYDVQWEVRAAPGGGVRENFTAGLRDGLTVVMTQDGVHSADLFPLIPVETVGAGVGRDAADRDTLVYVDAGGIRGIIQHTRITRRGMFKSAKGEEVNVGRERVAPIFAAFDASASLFRSRSEENPDHIRDLSYQLIIFNDEVSVPTRDVPELSDAFKRLIAYVNKRQK